MKRPNNAMSKAQHGHSLIEVMVSAMVLAISMLGLLRLQTHLMVESGDSRIRSHAMQLAQDEIEEWRLLSRAQGTSLTASDRQEVSVINDGTRGSTPLTRHWHIVPDPNTPGGGTLHVTVVWTDPRGQTQRVAMRSQLSTETLNDGKQAWIGLFQGS